MTADNPPADTRLKLCGKRACSHVFRDEETVMVPEGEDRNRGTCPKCGYKSFWMLNRDGSKPQRYADWEKFNPATMGAVTMSKKASPKLIAAISVVIQAGVRTAARTPAPATGDE